ncbi:MAG: hypothetical protein KKD64_16830 [Alphaproteobacteria bacterium]|nr:hypothetical protein [Alphaproteobacteria bacterium]MBU0793134.1 hypothetical protein [Alphaproteobacteria bacterium]MBU0875601.1 hypothetical protein [Alphaproteobacteria bacterium]MBU1771306.1 hypothetical protein [Alphaproteobacteria bacterium]
MGQLNPNGAIFLSAGVPDASAKHFMGVGDTAAISAAVSALLYVTLGRRRLVWGGHPSITPMVWSFAETMSVDYGTWVKLYQSEIFEDEFPEETARFQNVVITKRGDDVASSLEHMRKRMLDETDFSAAVFVGGMKGIMDEYTLFKERAPEAAIIPVMSTGGAAEVLGTRLRIAPSLALQLDYVALLHETLQIDVNEKRYTTPEQQPKDLRARIARPEHPA